MNLNTFKLRHASLLTAFIFLADQISKWWVVEQFIKPLALPDRTDPSATPFIPWLLNQGERMPFAREKILPFFDLVMVWNKGVSFGMFNSHPSGPIILTIVALVIVAFFAVWMVRTPSGLVRLGIAMIMGGALGNVLDRLRFGAVADFLDFYVTTGRWGELHWPAFNIGDSTICLGIAMLLIHSLFFDTKQQQAV